MKTLWLWLMKQVCRILRHPKYVVKSYQYRCIICNEEHELINPFIHDPNRQIYPIDFLREFSDFERIEYRVGEVECYFFYKDNPTIPMCVSEYVDSVTKDQMKAVNTWVVYYNETGMWRL